MQSLQRVCYVAMPECEHQVYFSQVVAPKRAALADANKRLEGANKKLTGIRAKVKELKDRVASLEDSLMKVRPLFSILKGTSPVWFAARGQHLLYVQAVCKASGLLTCVIADFAGMLILSSLFWL